MKAGIIGAILVILIAAAGAFYFLNQQHQFPESTTPTSKEDTVIIENSQTIDTNLTVGSNSSASTQSSNYQEYSKSAFENASSKQRILFFYASWCPTCRPADADFKASTSTIPANVAIFRVNYNDPETDEAEKDLAEEYGITYQHTYVLVDETGEEIKKWNGGALNKLISEVQ